MFGEHSGFWLVGLFFSISSVVFQVFELICEDSSENNG